MRIPPTENLILLGDQGLSARHIRECRAKVEDFRKRVPKGAVWSYKLIFRDGWAVLKVAQKRHKIIIYTEAGSCTYEMFTSELIEVNYLYTNPYDGTTNNLSVCGKGSFHTIGSAKKTAGLIDLCPGCGDGDADDPAEIPLAWSMKDCNTNAGLADMQTTDMWNVLKTQPALWYQGFLGEKFVIGGLDNALYYKPRLMKTRFNARTDPIPGGGFGWVLYTVGGRVPSAFLWDQFEPYSVGGITPGAGEYTYGGAICNTPTTELIFTVNGANTWYFWPTGDYSVTPPVRVETVAVGLGPTIDWGLETIQFNSTGTRGVAVLTETALGVNDDQGGIVYKAIQDTFKGITYGSGNVDNTYLGTKEQVREERPWLIEYNIAPFDDVSGDWQVNVTVGYQNRFLATNEWIMAADYLGSGFQWPKDSLVIATCEVYYEDAHGLTVGATPYWPDDMSVYMYALMHIKVWNATLAQFDTIRTFLMTDNLFTYPQPTIPYLDPFGNNQYGFQKDMIPGDDGTGGYYLALRTDTINALNLKTLSWVRYRFYQTQPGATTDTRVGSSCIEVWHKNNLAERKEQINSPHGPTTFSGSYDQFGVEQVVHPRVGWSPLTDDEIELWTPVAYSMFDPLLRGQFAWHPKGHFAVATPLTPIPPFQPDQDVPGDYFMCDIVQAHGNRTSNQALYNEAFGDTRTKAFYNDSSDYRGVFMTAALFRDK